MNFKLKFELSKFVLKVMTEKDGKRDGEDFTFKFDLYQNDDPIKIKSSEINDIPDMEVVNSECYVRIYPDND